MNADHDHPAPDPENDARPDVFSDAPGHELLEGLTDAQRQAVVHREGPLLVLAGPGSGKTSVVTCRVAWLIHQGVPPWAILALTFTNKAAGEMQERIAGLLGGDLAPRGLVVTTFHSFCARMLRRYAEAAGLAPSYSIYDAADQRDAIKQCIADVGLSSKNFPVPSVAAMISGAKNQLLDAEGYAETAFDFYSRSAAKVYKRYEELMRRNDAVDFDDLLMRFVRLLRTDAEVRDELQQRFHYQLVDEYQDTNHAQFMIAHQLAAKHQNICVVGDPDQSIYGWRGADIRNILEFEQHYPKATVIPLGQNFRSTPSILHAANILIQQNTQRKHKDLFTENEDGDMPAVVTCQDEHHEAKLVVDGFRELSENGVEWREMAVVYRVNALSRVLEDAFRKASIPYVIARGTAFYERKEIKDALSYLRVIANPNADVSLQRIVNTPTRGIGRTSLQKIELHAAEQQVSLFSAMRDVESIEGLTARARHAVAKFVAMVDSWRTGGAPEAGLLSFTDHQTFAELVGRVIQESGLESMYASDRTEEGAQRIENLAELVNAASDFAMPIIDAPDPETGEQGPPPDVQTLLTAFLESVALVSDQDAVDQSAGAVTLLTMHAAKGLEFDAVSIVGLEEGLLPHSRAMHDEMEREEERRLLFVGMTRARKHLLLTRAGRRTKRGMMERTIPSSFLGELPADGIRQADFGGMAGFDAAGRDIDPFESDYSDAPHADDYGDGSQSIDIGVLVRHPKFGLGRVEAVMKRPAGTSARINFNDVGVKTIILGYVPLQLVR